LQVRGPEDDKMRARWDSDAVALGDREESLRDLLWSSIVKIEVDHQVGVDEMRTRMDLSQAGQVGLLWVRSTGATIRRTARLASDDSEGALFLGFQLSGQSMVIQHGRQAVLNAGEFAIYDTSSPYTLINDGGIDHFYVRIPRAEIALPEDSLRAALAVPFGPTHPVAHLASTYLAHLATSDELLEPSYSAAIAAPTVELVRSVIATRTPRSAASVAAMQESLATLVLAYVRTHLGDPDLCAESIARAHSISVRHLYATLAKSGVSLGEWTRNQRLEACRRDLADAAKGNVTVAAIAARWGFADAAHFSRAFRAAYGMTPREWRATRIQGN
jgi:AraC-like DNA-binding protein